jgi:hypothetical protein
MKTVATIFIFFVLAILTGIGLAQLIYGIFIRVKKSLSRASEETKALGNAHMRSINQYSIQNSRRSHRRLAGF